MLYILTGGIQTGKTRWLQTLVDGLGERGVPVRGVLAPGVWRPNPAKPGGLEKLGIDNVLLPGGERVSFARRRDLDPKARSEMEWHGMPADMKLAWSFSDEAVAQVNAHFERLAVLGDEPAGAQPATRPGLLVVDELGRLELERGGLGLTSAVDLVKRGPRPAWPHALVVVRDWLVPRAREVLGPAWGSAIREIPPTPEARAELLGLFAAAE